MEYGTVYQNVEIENKNICVYSPPKNEVTQSPDK